MDLVDLVEAVVVEVVDLGQVVTKHPQQRMSLLPLVGDSGMVC